jgi:hypothetical protein
MDERVLLIVLPANRPRQDVHGALGVRLTDRVADDKREL